MLHEYTTRNPKTTTLKFLKKEEDKKTPRKENNKLLDQHQHKSAILYILNSLQQEKSHSAIQRLILSTIPLIVQGSSSKVHLFLVFHKHHNMLSTPVFTATLHLELRPEELWVCNNASVESGQFQTMPSLERARSKPQRQHYTEESDDPHLHPLYSSWSSIAATTLSEDYTSGHDVLCWLSWKT